MTYKFMKNLDKTHTFIRIIYLSTQWLFTLRNGELICFSQPFHHGDKEKLHQGETFLEK